MVHVLLEVHADAIGTEGIALPQGIISKHKHNTYIPKRGSVSQIMTFDEQLNINVGQSLSDADVLDRHSMLSSAPRTSFHNPLRVGILLSCHNLRDPSMGVLFPAAIIPNQTDNCLGSL